ncbi:type II TA system antitoxin MqsA family protein [Raoultibacter phocaeensis]|uniref:type II TA system antitoxin MqsA family protein n=1 Tax=Raoultibacter phocaeensis TaxID=2479841 RepID=UPI00111B9A11|nr:type II TA system antitoxin MqsA family protein [Raoultibacter phocaeensis]
MTEIVHTVCDECFCEVDACVETFHEELPIRDAAIMGDYEYPICPRCGNRIGHAATVDRNLVKAYRSYRELKDIPQPEELVALRKEKGLTQKVFAAALGIGVASVQRYEQGALPTYAHAQLLRSARDTRFLINRLKQVPKGINEREREKAIRSLEANNHACIDYAVVRLRVLDTVPSAGGPESGFRMFDANRLREIVLYLATHVRDLYRTKLNKVLFYLDFASFRDEGKGFTGLQYAKADFGPVPHQYELILGALTDGESIALREQGEGQVLVALRGADLSGFSPNEVMRLDAVSDFANGFASSRELSELSHAEKGWRETESGQCIDYRYADTLCWKR